MAQTVKVVPILDSQSLQEALPTIQADFQKAMEAIGTGSNNPDYNFNSFLVDLSNREVVLCMVYCEGSYCGFFGTKIEAYTAQPPFLTVMVAYRRPEFKDFDFFRAILPVCDRVARKGGCREIRLLTSVEPFSKKLMTKCGFEPVTTMYRRSVDCDENLQQD